MCNEGLGKQDVKTAVRVFTSQLGINALWSILFFGRQFPLGAFIEILFLWISIVASILLFYRISKPAAYLLRPYILWVTFAAMLNLAIVLLNP